MSNHNVDRKVADLLELINTHEDSVSFEQVMETIEHNYQYQPTDFTNGDLKNEAGTNEGSCKIFYFAQLHNLSDIQTLACFGRFYREDVLAHPDGSDHGNIRNFIKTGWQGIKFNQVALTPLTNK